MRDIIRSSLRKKVIIQKESERTHCEATGKDRRYKSGTVSHTNVPYDSFQLILIVMRCDHKPTECTVINGHFNSNRPLLLLQFNVSTFM